MSSTDLFKNTVSVRKFSQKPVEEEHVKALTSAIKGCFSMDNRQPWKVIIVRDEQLKKSIASACSNGKGFLEAPLAVVVCGLLDEAYPTLGGFINSYTVDAGILIERISSVAKHLGMQTDWVYVFKEEKIKEIIRAPEEARVVSLTPLGIADEISALPPAKQLHEIVAFDHF